MSLCGAGPVQLARVKPLIIWLDASEVLEGAALQDKDKNRMLFSSEQRRNISDVPIK